MSEYHFLNKHSLSFSPFFFFLSKEKNIDYRISIRRPVQGEITKGLLEQFVSEPILN